MGDGGHVILSPHEDGRGVIFQGQWAGLLFHMDNEGTPLYGGVTIRDYLEGGLQYQFLAHWQTQDPSL